MTTRSSIRVKPERRRTSDKGLFLLLNAGYEMCTDARHAQYSRLCLSGQELDRGGFMSIWKIGLAALLLAVGVGAGAQKMPHYPIEPFTLPNGLRVVLSEDHS